MNLSWLPGDHLSPPNYNSISSPEHSIKDCFVQMMKLEKEIENSLNMGNHLEQVVSLQSKGQKNTSEKPSSTENNYNKNDNSTNLDAAESEKISHCANCSFGRPCGDRCVYLDDKLSPETCSVQLRKLEDLIDDLSKPENSKDSDLGSVNFDASRNLFESYFNTSIVSLDIEHSDDKERDDKISDIIEKQRGIDHRETWTNVKQYSAEWCGGGGRGGEWRRAGQFYLPRWSNRWGERVRRPFILMLKVLTVTIMKTINRQWKK